MDFLDFLNSNRSYELFVKSSGIDFCEKQQRIWTLRRTLIRGLIMFVESFCEKHGLSKAKIFRNLSVFFSGYAASISQTVKKAG